VTYRSRLGLALAAATTFPVLLLGLGVRRELSQRLERQAEERVAGFRRGLRADLEALDSAIHRRLGALGQDLRTDNRLRLALRFPRGPERRWLLDWAGEAMRLSGLEVLQLRDPEGRILSSGHFRNEYDRVDPEPPSALHQAGGSALVALPAPDGVRMVFAGVEGFRLGELWFSLVGGRRLEDMLGSGEAGGELEVRLARSRVECGSGPELGGAGHVMGACWPGDAVAELSLAYLDSGAGPADSAWLVVTRDPAPLQLLKRDVDRWVAVALAVGLSLGLGLAWWLAAMVSRPLAELASRTGRLDLERLDEDVDTERQDELGALARVLAALAGRLRAGTQRLRDAERRAVTGDLARQINHDVKNGLTPIRHVLRHLSQTAEQAPERMAEVYAERRATLESSVAYLDHLARTYGRLSPPADARPTDAGALLAEVARAATTDGARVELECEAGLPPVRADVVTLRRILENLVTNGIEALGGDGRVWLTAARMPNELGSAVRLEVRDSGRGMTGEELERAFEDFYSTRPDGTGLGLSVVRRLVADLGGSLRVQTAPGQGTVFSVELPAA